MSKIALEAGKYIVNELGEFTISEFVGRINLELVYRAHKCALNSVPDNERR